MVKMHFITPVGEFIAVFHTMEAAQKAAGSEYEFMSINGEFLIIPLTVQNSSVMFIQNQE